MLELKLNAFHQRRLFSRGETHIEADFSPVSGGGEIVVGRVIELFLRSPVLPTNYRQILGSENPPETIRNRRGLPSEDNSGAKPETIFIASGIYEGKRQTTSAPSESPDENSGRPHFTLAVQTSFREFQGDAIVYNVATTRSGIISALGKWATPQRVTSLAPLLFDSCIVGSEVFRDGGLASKYGFGPSVKQHEELRATRKTISLRWMRIESRDDDDVVEDPFLRSLEAMLTGSGLYPSFLKEIQAKL